MVYGFVKQSGGHIKIYSEEGVGTTIRLYLPPAQGRIDAIAENDAEAAGGSETILVVEDDALVRGFVIAQLKNLGYKTISANDARAAMAVVDRGEPFDLLFTDVIMPGGMSGASSRKPWRSAGRMSGCSTRRAIRTTLSCTTAGSTKACCC
jgi:CheY-like chemotaxis protein